MLANKKLYYFSDNKVNSCTASVTLPIKTGINMYELTETDYLIKNLDTIFLRSNIYPKEFVIENCNNNDNSSNTTKLYYERDDICEILSKNKYINTLCNSKNIINIVEKYMILCNMNIRNIIINTSKLRNIERNIIDILDITFSYNDYEYLHVYSYFKKLMNFINFIATDLLEELSDIYNIFFEIKNDIFIYDQNIKKTGILHYINSIKEAIIGYNNIDNCIIYSSLKYSDIVKFNNNKRDNNNSDFSLDVTYNKDNIDSLLIDISKITDFIYEEYSYIVDNIISINRMYSDTETETEIED